MRETERRGVELKGDEVRGVERSREEGRGWDGV
jgi:hypothetical protein